MGAKISQEVAIRRFKSAWRDWKKRYDYSDVIYKNQNTLIKIKCLKHNQFFLQKPCDHWLGKNGCSDCKKDSKRALYCSNKEDFVKKANDTHKDNYNYSKVVYYNARTNVTITCPLHGDFLQTPDSHVRGSGCPICGYERGASKNALPFEEFEKKANKVHLKKFEYHKQSYFSASRKTKIKCPRHGVFLQLPDSHLKGAGCKKCAVEIFTEVQRLRTEKKVITTLNKIYGSKYEITKFFLKTDSRNKKRRCFEAKCNEHGIFSMSCVSLLSKGSTGCKKCENKKISNKNKHSNKEFIAEAIKLHDGFYDYSKVKYDLAKKPVTIICPVHGDFQQAPDVHLRPNGCKKCADEERVGILKANTYDSNEPYGVYLIQITNTQTKEKFLKVGLSKTSVKNRMTHLQKIYKFTLIAHEITTYSKAFNISDIEWKKEIKERELNKIPEPKLKTKGNTECAGFNEELLLKYSKKIFALNR